jgi:hypothetical protein
VLGADCGYTPAEIGKMTLHDVRRIFDHWKQFPSLRMIVASIAHGIGVKLPMASDISKPKAMSAEEFAMMMRMTGGKIDGIGAT